MSEQRVGEPTIHGAVVEALSGKPVTALHLRAEDGSQIVVRAGTERCQGQLVITVESGPHVGMKIA